MLSRKWKPIRNCPGRFILLDAEANLSLEEILGPDSQIKEFRTCVAKDAVLVAVFDEGGMISYKRTNGTFLHTLNTAEGFRRKLNQLQINLADQD